MIKELKDILPEKATSNPYGFKNYYGVSQSLL